MNIAPPTFASTWALLERPIEALTTRRRALGTRLPRLGSLLDMSEFRKMDGGLSCLSIRF
jgi:hypothetical protein